MRTLKWLGNSRKDVLTFPEEIRLQIGFALYTAQLGETHMHAKLFKGFGPGVYEIISDYDKNTYRTLYTVNIEDAIYVLHVFQKKSKHGIATPKPELKVLKERLKQLTVHTARERRSK